MSATAPLRQPSTTDRRPCCEARPIMVAVADDHQAARRNFRLSLEIVKDVAVVAEAGDQFTALRHLNRQLPDVILLDVWMPNGSSIELIRRLRAQAPTAHVVVMSTQESPAFAKDALDAGAAAYVVNQHRDTELALAVRRAARGQKYISPSVAARLDALRRAVTDDGLSQRETEVLRLVALGLTSVEIAQKLHLSRRTVDTHRNRIHHKLGRATRAELVRYALTHHLIGD